MLQSNHKSYKKGGNSNVKMQKKKFRESKRFNVRKRKPGDYADMLSS